MPTRMSVERAKTEQRRAAERGEEPPAWTRVVLAQELGTSIYFSRRPRKYQPPFSKGVPPPFTAHDHEDFAKAQRSVRRYVEKKGGNRASSSEDEAPASSQGQERSRSPLR